MEANDMGFKPTVEWMSEKYDEMNSLLFDGKLMDCDFGIFTSGRGSEGGVLGWFKMTGKNLKGRRSTRRLFKRYGWDEININRGNFVELCKPRIELNGNYSGKEESFLMTLVHEMCHYYTYMDGYMPVQAHGREFRSICSMVQMKSNGRFTIQRLASAEQMAGLELSDEMKEKRKRRLDNKKSKTTVLIYWDRDGKTKLVTTMDPKLVNYIKSNGYDKLIVSNDANLFEMLYNLKYRNNMRLGGVRAPSWRYWDVTGKDWLNELNEYDIEVYENGKLTGGKATEEPVNDAPRPEEPKASSIVFTITTNKGVVEIPFDGNYSKLVNNIKKRLPGLNDASIRKIATNPKNFKSVNENMNSVKKVLREVIEEFISNEGDDSISINPNENLGLNSPIENDV